MSELRVTAKTTLDELQKFAGESGDAAKIRGKQNKDGSITLYTSDKKPGRVREFFHRDRATKQTAARTAIATVLSGVKGREGVYVVNQRDPVQVAMSKMIAELPKSGELTAQKFKAILGDVEKAKAEGERDVDLHEVHSDQQRDVRQLEKQGYRRGFVDRRNLNQQISQFNRETLKKVTTNERTGLEHAKVEMQVDAAIDDLGRDVRPAPAAAQTTRPLSEPTFESLSGYALIDEKFRSTGQRLKEALVAGDQTAINNLATELGDVLAGDLHWTTPDVKLAFALSTGEQFKDGLLSALAKQLDDAGPLTGGYDVASKEVKGFLDAAFSRAASQVPNRQIDANTVEVNGKTYAKVKDLGDGAYGIATLYRSETGEQIVIKTPIFGRSMDYDSIEEEQPVRFKQAVNEVLAHRAAMGAGHPNIVGFQGAIRTPDGKVLIALDFASRGDARDLLDGLDQGIKAGTVPPEVANKVRATLLKDMLQGMRHVHETRGALHFDLKPANCFIGEDGSLQIGDFGTGAASASKTVPRSPVDQPRWLAPEVIHADNKLAAMVDVVAKQNNEAYDLAREAAGERLGKLLATATPEEFKTADQETDRELFALRREMKAVEEQYREDHPFAIAQSADLWSLGASAYEMFHGETPFEERWEDKLRANVAKFGEDPANRIRTLGTDDQGAKVGTGVTALDRLVNQLMHPDPTQRPNPSAALASSLFTEPGVGSAEVRELIKQLTTRPPNPQAVKAAALAVGV